MTNRLVIANWKMNGSLALVHDVVKTHPSEYNAEVIVVPPSIFASRLIEAADGAFQVGLQNVSHYEAGAHTGEVSAAMAAELGVTAVLIGHSERRSDNGEDDALVATKCQRVTDAGLMPVICVGETLAERESGQADIRVRDQIEAQAACLRNASSAAIAYEPVWAIGTGKSASAEEAVAMHQTIRQVLRDIVPETADTVKILYGGSVNGTNAATLFLHSEIQGVLVGGASLDTEQFAAIIRAADS